MNGCGCILFRGSVDCVEDSMSNFKVGTFSFQIDKGVPDCMVVEMLLSWRFKKSKRVIVSVSYNIRRKTHGPGPSVLELICLNWYDITGRGWEREACNSLVLFSASWSSCVAVWISSTLRFCVMCRRANT